MVSLNIYDRLGYISRIVDGLPEWRSLTFKELYEAWTLADFFASMVPKGLLFIKYQGSADYIVFDPVANPIKHVAMALSCYIASRYNENYESVEVRSPHESGRGGDFVAIFTRLQTETYTYEREDHSIVHLRFDPNQVSQFKRNSTNANQWTSFTSRVAGSITGDR
jgi:hypothetical protein